MKKKFAAIAQPAAIAWLRKNIDTPSLIDEVLDEVRRVTGR